MNAAKCWFGDGDHAKNCRGRAATLCHHGSGRLRLKCDGTRAETRFRLSTKRTSPFKSAGASVQSTNDSRRVRINGSNAGYTMFRGSVRVLATTPFASFPFTSPPGRTHVPSHFNWTLLLNRHHHLKPLRFGEQRSKTLSQGDVTHEDSYDVSLVPGAATTLQATPALNLIMQIGQFADPSGRAV